jgi:hypothetical protein
MTGEKPTPKPRRALYALLLAGPVIGGALGWSDAGGVGLGGFYEAVLLFYGPLFVTLLLLAPGWAMIRYAPRYAALSVIITSVLASLPCLLAGSYASLKVWEFRVRHASLPVIEALESAKSATGEYPDTLPPNVPIPALHSRTNFRYEPFGTDYSLVFDSPMNGYTFEYWHRSDEWDNHS